MSAPAVYRATISATSEHHDAATFDDAAAWVARQLGKPWGALEGDWVTDEPGLYVGGFGGDEYAIELEPAR